MLTQFGAFLAVSAIVIVTPGQDTALTIRNTLLGGRRHGVLTAAGVASGQLVWVVATSVGLAALLVASEPAFVALRVAGAAYLVWLGARALSSAWRGRVHGATSGSRRAPFRQGVLSNLGNPKMAVFFTSLLPQFAHSFAALLAHGLVFCALTLAWLSVVARVGSALRRPRVRRVVDAVTGAVLVALGLRLAGERR
jgi:threonine/homoserine/homoserine lactone efflux protein